MSELKSEKVKVNGKFITVWQASFVMNLQRSISISNASKDTPKAYENLDVQVVTYVHRLLYPSLVACSEGKVPNEETFLKLPNAEVEVWLDAASRLNPDWFSLNGEASKDKEKKQSPQS